MRRIPSHTPPLTTWSPLRQATSSARDPLFL